MVALQTPEVEYGWKAPSFNLLGTDNLMHNLIDVTGKEGLLVMFICNHCPYVQAILDKIVRDTNELFGHGIGAVAIQSNDADQYPEDSFQNMQKLVAEKHFAFPYLIDETQEVAKQYGAVCTPDFFGFNADLELQYRGRLDDSGMNNNPDATRELFDAMLQIAEKGTGPAVQKASIGCSIKWK